MLRELRPCGPRLLLVLGLMTAMSVSSAQNSTPDSLPTPESSGSAGSVYVSLDSWIYPAFDRLYALGYADTAYLGLRPWTRLSCLHILEKTQDKIDLAPDDSEAKRIFAALTKEFAQDAEATSIGGNIGRAELDELYSRSLYIAGRPLTDSAHFGQTIINDYGRPYEEGFNAVDGFIAWAEKGRFSLNVRGEYQHAPGRAPTLYRCSTRSHR